MTIQLSRTDFQRLTRIVQNLPDFANVRDRRRLITGALQGVSQSDIMLARIDLDGTPMSVAVEIVQFFSQFGRVAYDKEALSVFLNYIQPFTGDEDTDFIIELFQNYPLDVPVSPNREINNWKGFDSTADIKEKIIGEKTLHDIYILDLAKQASSSVVRIRTSKELGTGFMVAPDLVMTNNHVINSEEIAEKSNYTFNYQLDINGKECPTQTVGADIGGVFYTNEELDFTIVSLSEVPDFGKPRTLKSKLMRCNDRVAIIQHPGGHLKKISMQNNFIAYADNQILQYTTSTEPGSSGAPVFDSEFQVVGIHHSGGMLQEPNTEKYYLRNAGTSAIALLNDLKTKAPSIYARLQ